ncbi:hypothetical protein GJ496_002258 [Pomphorhynchus laevis]|nr:hypothetical protein GJ496_002258 [Pomphorhynchus laevis]
MDMSNDKPLDVEVIIIDEQSNKLLTTFYNISSNNTIQDVKLLFQNTYQHFIAERQRYKTKNGTLLSDDTVLRTLMQNSGSVEIYFRDLGPQISWRGVFVTEYIGPIVIYLTFYCFPSIFYSDHAARPKKQAEVHILCLMWSIHYIKRLLESLFVHRFSHSTMPLGNLFKNCSYYWGFSIWIGYLLNHPFYTKAFTTSQLIFGCMLFAVCEYGNGQCHILLRHLRPAGSESTRKIPFPNDNLMTKLFNYVSCPNYTYEVFAWVGFSIASQCLAVMIFTVAGFAQMASWAKKKHQRYVKEFPEYPIKRKAIIPFIY